MATSNTQQDFISDLLNKMTARLSNLEGLEKAYNDLTTGPQSTEYKKQTIDDTIPCNESLEIIGNLGEFNGKTDYPSWREAANNALSLYTVGSRRYFAALIMLRNKITCEADDVLTDHGTVLNFEAILARLDMAFVGMKSIQLMEQELSTLRQGFMSIMDFYNLVNEKLTLLINKTVMTHGRETELTRELNERNRSQALRIFITGLKQPLGGIISSLQPPDLPKALAKAQELESNNLRKKFEYQFKTEDNIRNNKKLNKFIENHDLRLQEENIERNKVINRGKTNPRKSDDEKYSKTNLSKSVEHKTDNIKLNLENILKKPVKDEKIISDLKLKIRQKINDIHSKINTNLPFRTDVQAEIRTKVDTPIWTKQYPYPLSANKFVESEIQKLLDSEIVRPSKSPYNSPIWVGANEVAPFKQHLVIDYKKLNEITVADKYPIPDTNVLLSNFGEAEYFSTIDLESGFHQIQLREEDIEKTAFSINSQKYEYIRMPLGLKNATSIFQRAMDNILREHLGEFCHIYIDAIIVFSKTLNEHTQHLEIITDSLKRDNMKISLEKSHFYKKEIEFLGYVITHKTLKTDPKKIETIDNFPQPTTLRQLRSFLGMTGYYRKFIKDYAEISKPLTKYLSGENARISTHLSKKTLIDFDESGRKAFEKLKRLLRGQLELAQPDFKQKFILTTEASNEAIAAVLTQDGGKPIIFISKTLNSSERNYATDEKQLYAIVWSLKNLRYYLYDSKDLEIHSDYQSLSPSNSNAKMERWHAIIEEYSPKMVYKTGTTNV